ncbi:hypothetical protein NM208_g2151 [Fusarium decemcellulare]|uniref:Uncharacterized protein n=1 Tax=Fusarium decemcellulare TaxID=57161 RepID=A0ACC1STL8_9HYPO|nr:hypothetical protein NM208_g2151 [Fusarium decemcellulare]
MLPVDINYVESQGCLRVPERPILDHFVHNYFLSVHPILPILDETAFWDMYSNQSTDSHVAKLPLMLFQTVLHRVHSNAVGYKYVSEGINQALGFSNIQEAKLAWYRRCKILYDFETESSPVVLAQTALLLAFGSPQFTQSPKKQNIMWLKAAIHHTTNAEGHIQAAFPTTSSRINPINWRKKNTLKRLWWSCIFCDRILAVSLRTSCSISRAHFGLGASPVLGYADLSHEIGRSRVYTADTQRRLVEVVEQMAKLCTTLTDVSALVYPFGAPTCITRQRLDQEAAETTRCRNALDTWYLGAKSLFSVFDFGDQADSLLTPATENSSYEDAVMLHISSMYMHHYSAKLALNRHEIFLELASASVSQALASHQDLRSMHQIGLDIQDTMEHITKQFKYLLQRDRVRKLPSNVVAFTALPLLLNLVDLKLFRHNSTIDLMPLEISPITENRKPLEVLLEVLRSIQPVHNDDVVYVLKRIRLITDAFQPGGIFDSHFDSLLDSRQRFDMSVSNWRELLVSQPGTYLQLVTALDLSLKGALTEDKHFSLNFQKVPSARSPDVLGQSWMSNGDFVSTTLPSSPQETPYPPSSLESPLSIHMVHENSGISPNLDNSPRSDEARQESIEDLVAWAVRPSCSITSSESPSMAGNSHTTGNDVRANCPGLNTVSNQGEDTLSTCSPEVFQLQTPDDDWGLLFDIDGGEARDGNDHGGLVERISTEEPSTFEDSAEGTVEDTTADAFD